MGGWLCGTRQAARPVAGPDGSYRPPTQCFGPATVARRGGVGGRDGTPPEGCIAALRGTLGWRQHRQAGALTRARGLNDTSAEDSC